MNYDILKTFLGEDAFKNLQDKTIAIIGLGGVGVTTAQILVRNGISLRVVDKGRVEEKDVPRQTLYISDDVTKFKAKQAKKRLEEINSEVKIKTFHEELTKENIFLIEADLIIDTSNDMKTSKTVHEFASAKKIPLLFANCGGDKANIILSKGTQIPEKLAFPPLKKIGMYSPLTTVLAGILASEAMKQLLDDGDERAYTIDLGKLAIKTKKV